VSGYAPLRGLRILDLSRLIPGAGVTHCFADLGAEVVKVEEPPVGDYLRDVKPMIGGLSLQEMVLDRNKRSLALSLRTPAGRAVLHHLVATADALVAVSPPSAMVGRGADWETVRAINPRLVYLSFTGFGTGSPYADLPTHGSNLACFAGVHGVEERPDGALVPATLPYGRYRVPMEHAALHAAFHLLAALHERERTGRGRFVDVSVAHALMAADYAAMVDIVAHGSSYMVNLPQPTPRYAFYRAADAKVLMVCPIEWRFWAAFCAVLDRPDLAQRGDWSTNEMDFAPGDLDLYFEIQAVVATRPRAEWLADLIAARVPCAPAYSVEEAVADPAIGGRIWVEAVHPLTGERVRTPGPIVQEPWASFESRPAPHLGQDDDEVLDAYGVPADLRRAARKAGALGGDR
jgi:formyl-CoA transferase